MSTRPDGSQTPINYLDGKTAVQWAYYLATADDLRQARDDLNLITDPAMTAEHHAILDAAHFFRFGRFVAHA
jgi:hypothetical protein